MKALLLPLLSLCLIPTQAQADEPDAGKEPALVGRVGRCHRMAFEGNEIFTADELRKGLAADASFAMAARPTEPLDHFLKEIPELLIAGYRKSGCPDAKVRMTHRPGNEALPFLVTIEEGKRYRQGKIIIEGVDGIDRERLIADLTQGKPRTPMGTLLERIREAAEAEESRLPKEGAHGPDYFEKWGELHEASWNPGQPVPFKGEGVSPLLSDIKFHLAEQGRANARVRTRHRRGPDGVADLMIDIEDPGPDPEIGQIIIEGANRFGREEILQLTGLHHGDPVAPQDIDRAMLGLWNSGRFFPFAIQTENRNGPGPEIDIRIRLCEIDDTPPLDQQLSPEQEAVLKFIEWVNLELDGEEFLVTYEIEGDGAPHLAVGWSAKSGLLAEVGIPERQHKVALRYSQDGFDAVLGKEDLRLSAHLGIRLRKNWIRLLPTHEEKPLAISVASQFLSNKHRQDLPPSLGILVSPSVPLLKADSIRREGDTVIIEDLLELDLATGKLLGIGGGSVDLEPGCVEARMDELRNDVGRADELGIDEWRQVVSEMIDENLPGDAIPAEIRKQMDSLSDMARLLDILREADAFGTLEELSDLFVSKDDPETFRIPSSFKPYMRSQTASLLASIGFFWAIEESAPDADWPTVLARELLILRGGGDEHCLRNLETLLSDPELGPLGAILCARLVESDSRELSQRFLKYGKERSNETGFRKDWRILTHPNSFWAEPIEQVRASFVAASPEKLKEMAELLPARLDGWLPELHQTLGKQQGASLDTESIAPHMDRLWEAMLKDLADDYFERKIDPPADPETMAATADGTPIPRYLVRLARDMQMGAAGDLIAPEPDEARPWTMDPALASVIRATLILEKFRKQDAAPEADALDEFFAKEYPELVGKDAQAWIEATGYTRDQLDAWHRLLSITGYVVGSAAKQVAVPDDDKVLLDHFRKHKRLFCSLYSSQLVFIKPANGNDVRSVCEAYRLASALASLPDDGLSLEAVGKLADLEPDTGIKIFPQNDVDPDTLNPSILEAIEDLAPGETSDPTHLGAGVAVVRLVARKDDPRIEYDDMKDAVLAHWKSQQVREKVQKMFANLDAELEVLILEDPKGPRMPTSPLDRLRLEHPEAMVGRLLNGWKKLGSEVEADVSNALNDIFQKAKDDESLICFMLRQELKDTTRECLKRAAAADRAKAGEMSREIEEFHSTHGEGGCAVYHTLKALRKEVFGEP
ncbi:outermembrane protein assembly protein YaeT [Haloferula helveola]|uniref:Outermembrane protein assembly protein YaeT n=1 Tax=Haloferula helveola TaxID=490095 RepID=A0ABM7REV9_9BACT|nr:outermembrane protein assembly protein YaeT [Haloferula helveola]